MENQNKEINKDKNISDLLTIVRAKRDYSTFAPVKGSKLKTKNGQTLALEENNIHNEAENTEGVADESKLEKANVKPIEKIKTDAHKPKKTPKVNPIAATQLQEFIEIVQEAEEQDRYTFSQNKRYYVDDTIFQTLALLKNAGRVKNISVMVNTVLSQYFENMQEDIATLLGEINQKRNNQK